MGLPWTLPATWPASFAKSSSSRAESTHADECANLSQSRIGEGSAWRRDRSRTRASTRLLLPPALSICCFRYRADGLDEPRLTELNQQVVRLLRAETRYVPSTHVVGEKLAIRTCFVNASTTLAEVEGLAAAVVALGHDSPRKMSRRYAVAEKIT